MVGNSGCFLDVLEFLVFVNVDYARLRTAARCGGDDMDDFRGHDADGGQVLELSLHDVEIIVESPGHVCSSR